MQAGPNFREEDFAASVSGSSAVFGSNTVAFLAIDELQDARADLRRTELAFLTDVLENCLRGRCLRQTSVRRGKVSPRSLRSVAVLAAKPHEVGRSVFVAAYTVYSGYEARFHLCHGQKHIIGDQVSISVVHERVLAYQGLPRKVIGRRGLQVGIGGQKMRISRSYRYPMGTFHFFRCKLLDELPGSDWCGRVLARMVAHRLVLWTPSSLGRFSQTEIETAILNTHKDGEASVVLPGSVRASGLGPSVFSGRYEDDDVAFVRRHSHFFLKYMS